MLDLPATDSRQLTGYIVFRVVVLHFLHLHCNLVLVPLDIVSPMILFFKAFISCTGGQSVTHVLLWQPSECVRLMVVIVKCCSCAPATIYNTSQIT